MDREQAMAALERANEVRLGAKDERESLAGKGRDEVEVAICQPSEVLGRMKLRTLFVVGRVIPSIGEQKLNIALKRLSARPELIRRHWSASMRLGELTEHERKALAEEVFALAPKKWRGRKGSKWTNTSQGQWLDGPAFLAWLEAEGAKPPSERRRRWAAGGRVSTKSADQYLTETGLHLSLVPDEVWL